MTTGNYPVIEERALPPVARHRSFRALRRDPETLPPQAPGTVYVFEYDGCYQDPYSRRVFGTEPHVIDATAVSLVQLRDRVVTVRRSMPSARAGTNLVVSVAFRCVVTDPVVVASGGLTDLESVLATHVAADRELATLGRVVRPERAADAVLRIEAQLRAHCTVNPPDVRGVEAVVVAVEVHAESTAAGGRFGLDERALGDLFDVDPPEPSLYEQAASLLEARFGRRDSGPKRDEDEHAR
jgi:hypothetical protein